MKKLVAITLAVLFVGVMAAAAFATETTFEGQYRVRAWSEWNFDKRAGYIVGDADPQYDGWFDQRFRLTITHTRSEFLKAVVRFDIVEDTWGTQRPFRMNNNGHGLGIGSVVDLAYIEFALPKIGTFTVGRFPLDFGNGLVYSSGGFWYGSDGLKWENTWGPVTVAAMYLKMFEVAGVVPPTNPYYNRDSNMWAADIKIAATEKHLINLFGGVLTTNATWVPTYLSAGVPMGGGYHWAAMVNNYGGALSADSTWTIGFVGLAYTGNIADMIDIKAEYNRIMGSAKWNVAHTALPVGVDDTWSVEGWNAFLDVSYYNDLFRVGLAFVMGSGAKHDWNLTSLHNINMTNIREDNFWWGNVVGNGYGGGNSIYWGPGFGGNAENLTSVKLYFEIYPMEKLSLNAAVIWAKWTDPVGTNPLVDPTAFPAYPHPANWYSHYGFQSWTASDDLGWEIDFGFNYEIMEGLDYTFGAGVLFTGDSWDYVNAANGTREEWGPIWSISNVLKYTF
jgi:hypothetical protein